MLVRPSTPLAWFYSAIVASFYSGVDIEAPDCDEAFADVEGKAREGKRLRHTATGMGEHHAEGADIGPWMI